MVIKLKNLVLAALVFALNFNAYAQEPRVITLKEFIETACQKDIYFQQILIDELKLKYSKALALPAGDLVVEVEGKHKFLYNPDEEGLEDSVTLTKLFPYIGTEISAEYTSSIATSSRKVTSDITFELSQPIAQNAFGRNTRLLDKITGIEIDVARYQIAEAYEDYLASLISLYYDWYSAYENLKTASNSHKENLKLLENIKEREKNKIALPIDVNKVTLQVLAKKENLITRRNDYSNYLNEVKDTLGYEKEALIEPCEPVLYGDLSVDFDSDYETFKTSSRTSKVLKLLEDKSSLEVDKSADELLPSINLLFGYKREGDKYGIEDAEKTAYTGMSIDWPLPGKEERAEYETSKIDFDKQKLSTETTTDRLFIDLKNLHEQMQKEKALIAAAEEKITLAENIVKDEKRNYSLGRSTLNDLIDEVNKLEDNKFNKITHSVQLRKLINEWLRLSDSLIKESDVLSKS